MMRVFAAMLLMLALAGCDTPSGERASGFVNDSIARAYISIEGRTMLIRPASAAGVVIAPGVAVTNAHVAAFLGDRTVIGTSRNYDLMFFHVAAGTPVPASGPPAAGMQVIAYGEDLSGTLRVAHGVVRGLNMPVKARCETCAVQSSFVYEGNAGPGFSGGPVVDAATGRLIGITFGYEDKQGKRLMYAYPISRVHNELATILGKLPVDVD